MSTTGFLDEVAQKARNDARLSTIHITAKRLERKQALFMTGGRIGLLVVGVAVWQFISGRYVDPLFISSPLAVWDQLMAWIADGSLWFHTEITLEETLLGLVFGIASGVLVGFFFGIEQWLAKLLDPFVTAIYSIPKIALAPLFILWFGIDIQMKIIFTTLTVFFLVFFNTLAGVRNVDQNLIDAVHLMGGKRRDILLKVIVPSATGYMLTGINIAIPYALIGAVIAELIASNRGLGYLIDSSATSFNTAGVFAALLILTIIGSLLNAVVNFIDRKTSHWKVGIRVGEKIIP
jgi:NitT/TauT family transport system permease protein